MPGQSKSRVRETTTSTRSAGSKKPLKTATTPPIAVDVQRTRTNDQGQRETFAMSLDIPAPMPVGSQLRQQPIQDLLQISTNEQGTSVVSARELYNFLEVRSKFIDWFTRRVEKYGFVEDQDFVRVSQKRDTLGGEQEGVDYALTLDIAKELSMVQNNQKGKQARRYFIDCEKQLKLKQQAVPMTEMTLLQQLVAQNRQLVVWVGQLQQDVAALRQQPPGAGPSGYLLPGMTLRQQVVRQINAYAARSGIAIRDVYSYFYQRFLIVCSIDVFALGKPLSGSYLESIDTHGHMERFYQLVVDEIAQAQAC